MSLPSLNKVITYLLTNLINLFSCSTDLSPRPPLSLRRSSTALELRECLPPFSRSTSLSLYQCSAALPMATVGSTLGTSRQARRTGLLPWGGWHRIDVSSRLSRAIASTALLQVLMLTSRHHRLSHTQELVFGPDLKVVDQSRLVSLGFCYIFNLLALPDMGNVAVLWIHYKPISCIASLVERSYLLSLLSDETNTLRTSTDSK